MYNIVEVILVLSTREKEAKCYEWKSTLLPSIFGHKQNSIVHRNLHNISRLR